MPFVPFVIFVVRVVVTVMIAVAVVMAKLFKPSLDDRSEPETGARLVHEHHANQFARDLEGRPLIKLARQDQTVYGCVPRDWLRRRSRSSARAVAWRTPSSGSF